MPGAGKSTIGVLLAKDLGKKFIDTDIIIQENENMLAQDIIDTYGIDAMLKIEEKNLIEMETQNTVIATGGSVVYSNNAMNKLSKNGILIYLKLPFKELENRVKDIKTRGVIKKENQTFYDLYLERLPLYEKYAQITIDCFGKNVERILEDIMNKVDSF